MSSCRSVRTSPATTRSGRRPAHSPEADGGSGAGIVFFGSGSFAVPILEALVALPDVTIPAVISVPPPEATPVSRRAVALGLEVLVPTSLRDPAFTRGLGASGASAGVLADYGRIVPATIIELFPAGILNVHPSLLPRWRGASPIQATVAAGDACAGVTVIAMDAGIDSGPIVAADGWDLDGSEDGPALRSAAGLRGAALLATVLPAWLAGDRSARPQDDRLATTTRELHRDDGALDPGRPAPELERLVRALRPWPGCHVETEAGRLLVWRARPLEGDPVEPPGMLVRVGDDLALATIGGRLVLEEVQPAGGRRMDGAEFLRGRGRLLPGTSIGAPRTMDRPWMSA
jgi:methionyl-tRNA formyltransferase